MTAKLVSALIFFGKHETRGQVSGGFEQCASYVASPGGAAKDPKPNQQEEKQRH